MTNKSEQAQKFLAKIQVPWPSPRPVEGANLLQQGFVAVLMRRVSWEQAKGSLERVTKAYPDWNELRVAQAQEVASHLRGPKAALEPAARDIKTYLQEVFQQSHGLDLDFLAEDPQQSARFISQLTFLGLPTSTWLLSLARAEELPIVPSVVRVLDRLGLMARTASVKRARAAIEPLIGKNGSQAFLMGFSHVAESWCDSRKPLCWECPLVGDCQHGKKVYRDWTAQQARLAAQREREDVRRQKAEKVELERRKREEERERKRAEAEAKKRQREEERRGKALERARAKVAREKAREQARLERERAKADALKKRKAEEARQEAARKKAAAKKKAAKKPAKKAAKKPASRAKPAAASKSRSARKKTAAAPASRKAATKAATKAKTKSVTPARKKKTAARKKTTAAPKGRKATPKKPAAKKKAPARKSAQKAVRKKTTSRRSSSRRR